MDGCVEDGWVLNGCRVDDADVRCQRGDRGQAAIVVAMVVSVLFVVVIAALVVLGGRAIDRTRAQSLADAAALGSVGRDRGAAARLVGADGGTLLSWSANPDRTVVTVVVRVGDATATARASIEP